MSTMWHCVVLDESGNKELEVDVESPSWRSGGAPKYVNVPRVSHSALDIMAEILTGKVPKSSMVDVLRVPLAYVLWPRDGSAPTAVYRVRER